MHLPMAAQRDWNVVVTVYEEGWKPAKPDLGEAGAISPTDYHDVLVMKVEDPRAFLDWFAQRVKAGYECGISLESHQDIRVGDRLESFMVQEVARSLAAAA
jgi:hypothetical protein